MAIRFYIMPTLQVGNRRASKYFFDPFINPGGILTPGTRVGIMYYGLIDACLVVATVTTTQHDELMLHSDVASPPENIDQNVSTSAIPRVQSVLEALRIPADWVNETYTYRQLLRMVAGLFQFSQRYQGMHHEMLIDSQAQLDLAWNQIPTARRNRILATADNLGYDYSSFQPTWTVRRILKHLADAWGSKQILFSSYEL